MKTQIYFVRHGQHIVNKQDNKPIFDSEFTGLTDKGKLQAEELGRELSQLKFDVILVSTLKRTQETASYILPHQPQAEVHHTELIREAFQGPYSKLPFEEYNKINFDKPPIEIEAFELLCLRAEYILKRVHADFAGKKILLIAHAGLNKALIARAKGTSMYDKELHQENACINLIEIADDGTRSVIFVSQKTLVQ